MEVHTFSSRLTCPRCGLYFDERVFHSERTVSSKGAGWSARFSNNSAYSGVTTMRSRANSATTLIAKATKKG